MKVRGKYGKFTFFLIKPQQGNRGKKPVKLAQQLSWVFIYIYMDRGAIKGNAYVVMIIYLNQKALKCLTHLCFKDNLAGIEKPYIRGKIQWVWKVSGKMLLRYSRMDMRLVNRQTKFKCKIETFNTLASYRSGWDGEERVMNSEGVLACTTVTNSRINCRSNAGLLFEEVKTLGPFESERYKTEGCDCCDWRKVFFFW